MHFGFDILIILSSKSSTNIHNKGGDIMTDSEKLDLILSKLDKIDSLENEIQEIKKDINSVKRQIMKSTAELKAMDKLILDEVERVHEILDKHEQNKSIHTA